MAVEPLPRNAVSEEIVSKLLTLIQTRQLRPGDRLPPERDLASMMQVSRPSVREALRALVVMNVVEVRHGAGTFVSSLKPELLVEHLDFVFALDDSTYLQLFEARRILEVGICGIAAQHITDAELAAIEACVMTEADALADPERFFQADLQLHARIAEAAGNPILNRFMTSLNRLGRASRNRTVEIPGMVQQTIDDHRAIVKALKARDPEAARLAMLLHLRHVEHGLKAQVAHADPPLAAPVSSR